MMHLIVGRREANSEMRKKRWTTQPKQGYGCLLLEVDDDDHDDDNIDFWKGHTDLGVLQNFYTGEQLECDRKISKIIFELRKHNGVSVFTDPSLEWCVSAVVSLNQMFHRHRIMCVRTLQAMDGDVEYITIHATICTLTVIASISQLATRNQLPIKMSALSSSVLIT